MTTLEKRAGMEAILRQSRPRRLAELGRLRRTVGATTVFPSRKVDGQMTINGARGCHPRIKDRLDLTVECIRRHYEGVDSPLADALGRYGDFFALFGSFRGYVDFFLLSDLVDPGDGSVRFFLPFDDFRTPALPASVEAYDEFVRRSVELIRARNRRIADDVSHRT